MTNAQRVESEADHRALTIVRGRPGLTAYLISQRTGWTTGRTEEVLERLRDRCRVESRPKTNPINERVVQGWWPAVEGGEA